MPVKAFTDLDDAFAVKLYPVDGWEYDDTSNDARPIRPQDRQMHSLHATGDLDWVRFTLTGPSTIILQTNGYGGGTAMRLYDELLTQLAYDADSGPERFSHIERTLVAGSYFVNVEEASDSVPINPYFLRLLDRGDVIAFSDVPGGVLGEGGHRRHCGGRGDRGVYGHAVLSHGFGHAGSDGGVHRPHLRSVVELTGRP